jgi:phosphonate transport system permease protein
MHSNIRNLKKTSKKKSLVSPIIASLLSAVIPGLGQALAREWRRGLIVAASFWTSFGLLIWRIAVASDRYKDLATKIQKAFYLNPTLYIISGLIALVYILNIIDAYQLAKSDEKKGKIGLLVFLILIVFFAQGWEIGQIEPMAIVRDANEALPALSRVMWPWEKAIVYPEEFIKVIVEVQSPCTDTPFPSGEIKEDEPFLIANPTCGSPTEVAGEQGTEFHLRGENFETGKEVEIWWKDPINNEFRHRVGKEYLKITPDDDGTFEADLIMPYRIMPAVAGEGEKLWQIQARQLFSVGKAEASQELKLSIEKMIETIFIGMMATFFGIILAVPVSFLSAKNLMSQSPITLGVYYISRTLMNIIRSIEPLIWAIIAVIVVGLGPFAGILALTLHSLAALAKLYSEAIESIDPGPIEAIQATGANWIQVVMYAVVPQIIPPFVSFTIYRWDINIRMSTVIGFVGGGGIGFLLQQWIRLLDYRAAGIAVWFIAITVAILDYVSAEIRERFV